MHLHKDYFLIYLCALLRSIGVSLIAVVIGIYWAKQGFSVSHIGVLTTLGLMGGAVATLAVSFWADQIGRKNFLLILSFLSLLGAFVLILKLTNEI